MLTPKVTCRVIGTCHPMKRTESTSSTIATYPVGVVAEELSCAPARRRPPATRRAVPGAS
jgi:hypothetical protein